MSKYPFNRDVEMQVKGVSKQFPGFLGMTMGGIRELNKPISPKENVMRVYNGEMPLWCPSVMEDINCIQPQAMPDAAARCHGGIDWFGIDWEYEPKSNAAMVRPGTRRLNDICAWEEELVFPDLNDIDWEKDYNDNFKDVLDRDKATEFVIVNGCLERLADMSSFEDALSWLLLEDEAVTELFTRFTDFHIELARIAHDVYGADIITFHDDMGTQRSPFLSKDVFDDIFVPQFSRMNKAIHDMGMVTNYHSCGNVDMLLPSFIDAGFDSWEGQDNANDKHSQMERYGEKLAHHSNFFINEVMDDKTLDKFLLDKLEEVGFSGRYISFFIPMVADMEFGMKAFDRFYEISREYYSDKQ